MTIKYNQSKIYKIWSTEGPDIYIGATTKLYLSQRMSAHRKDYDYWKLGKIKTNYTSFILFDKYGIDNCFIELIEAKPCLSSDELHSLEGGYIRKLECVNKNIAGRSPKESQLNWKINNPEKIKNFNKNYRETHQDQIRNHNNFKNNCECGGSFTNINKACHLRSNKHCKFINNNNVLVQ
jgi:hypothetical protein